LSVGLVVVEAVGAGVLDVAAGGEDVDGEEAGGVDVCANALVNANALTAVTAMTCFNMSASWGDCSKGLRSPAAKPASCMANAQAPRVFRFRGHNCAAISGALH